MNISLGEKGEKKGRKPMCFAVWFICVEVGEKCFTYSWSLIGSVRYEETNQQRGDLLLSIKGWFVSYDRNLIPRANMPVILFFFFYSSHICLLIALVNFKENWQSLNCNQKFCSFFK